MNKGRMTGDALALGVGRLLSIIALALLIASGLLYIAMVLAVRGDWPAEGEIPEGLPGIIFRLWSIVDVAVEFSASTWFNALLWSLLGLAAVASGLLAGRHRGGWAAFATVAFLASLDESTALHERLQDIGAPMAQAFGVGVVYAWVVPGAIIAAVVAIVLWPLVRALPRASVRLIVAGGALFLLGAIVLETISGQMVGYYGAITWQNMLVTHVEEALEKFGIVLAIMGVVRLFSVERTGPRRVRLAFADLRAEGEEAHSPAAPER